MGRQGAGRGIRKGRKAVFNKSVRPFTRRVKPGQVVTVIDNSHDYFVIVQVDEQPDSLTVPRHCLDPLTVLDRIAEATE